MSADGLWYIPEGFREGARANTSAAEAAETTQRALRQVRVNAAGWGGADAFVGALTTTRDAQARGAAVAAEGRQHMATADHRVADLGEEVDTAAGQALDGAAAALRVPPDQSVAGGI